MSFELELHEATFRLFGSPCRIVSDVEPSVLAAVHRLEDLQARWSRFEPTSEVSQLNRRGDWTPVSEITRVLIERACEASQRTRGRMNPLMLDVLIELGYDRSHELLHLLDDRLWDGVLREPTDTWRAPDPGAIEFDGAAVRLPAGASFDPGGIGKGLAADVAMEDLLAAGATWALVSLGGDLRFGGSTLAEIGWTTDVEDPHNRERVATTVTMWSGALASSSRLSRTWGHAGRVNHHLLDPSTGAPAVTRRVAATVHADEAWWADVVAKVLVIDDTLGAQDVAAWSADALVFDADGAVTDFGLLSERVSSVAS